MYKDSFDLPHGNNESCILSPIFIQNSQRQCLYTERLYDQRCLWHSKRSVIIIDMIIILACVWFANKSKLF